MHSTSEILKGLDCLADVQHKCQECPFNPHPGMDWPYGCIKGQSEIVREAKETIVKQTTRGDWRG